MNKLIINHLLREKRYALLKNETIEKLVIDQPKQHSSVGNIYLGIAEKVLPGMNAVFVEIGEGKNGYLHRDKLASFLTDNDEKSNKDARSISSYVHQGERLLVQIEKDAAGTKGPRLTNIIELHGENLVFMPQGRYVAVSKKFEDNKIRETWRQFGYEIKEQQEGLIFRTSCRNKQKEDLIAELQALRYEYKHILQKMSALKKPGKIYESNTFLGQLLKEAKKMEKGEIIVDDPQLKLELNKYSPVPVQLYTGRENIFSAFRLDHEIEKALKRIVWLDNGAYLIFDEAEALTIIDVNTGKYSGKNDLRETVIKTNERAAIEAARQIRLRDIGGMVLIDFIDMKEEKDKQHILNKMEAELKKDERRTNLIGFTPLGILQITRKKTKPALTEMITAKCPLCDGTGRILSPETQAFRLERELWEYRDSDHEAVIIQASDEVAEVFCGEKNIHKQRVEEVIGLKIIFMPIKSEKPFYEIRQFGKASELNGKIY